MNLEGANMGEWQKSKVEGVGDLREGCELAVVWQRSIDRQLVEREGIGGSKR